MTDETPFRTPLQELEDLTRQTAEIKEVLKDLQRRITAIEKHAKRAFASPPAKTGSPGRSRIRNPPSAPTLSTGEALSLFDVLVEQSRGGSRESASVELGKLSIEDLELVATEVGLTGLSKLGRKAVEKAILGRVQEAVMLSRNINVTSPRNDPSSSEGDSSGLTA